MKREKSAKRAGEVSRTSRSEVQMENWRDVLERWADHRRRQDGMKPRTGGRRGGDGRNGQETRRPLQQKDPPDEGSK